MMMMVTCVLGGHHSKCTSAPRAQRRTSCTGRRAWSTASLPNRSTKWMRVTCLKGLSIFRYSNKYYLRRTVALCSESESLSLWACSETPCSSAYERWIIHVRVVGLSRKGLLLLIIDKIKPWLAFPGLTHNTRKSLSLGRGWGLQRRHRIFGNS